ncbi:MAG: hypothetical protein HC904_17035 [Blastochloris sp.]|nr:hypothetical protein [Blastochloris sp.]
MKLLVFAHVPPPHHGQAVMVELMLRGLENFQTGLTGLKRDELPQKRAENAEKKLKNENAEKLEFSNRITVDRDVPARWGRRAVRSSLPRTKNVTKSPSST